VAIGQLRAEEAVPKLEQVLQAEPTPIGQASITAALYRLKRYPAPEEVQALRPWIRQGGAKVRQQIVHALLDHIDGNQIRCRPFELQLLLETLADPDVTVSCLTVRALARFEMRSLIPFLATRLPQASSDLKVCLAAALLKLNADTQGRFNFADEKTLQAFLVEGWAQQERLENGNAFLAPEHYLLAILKVPTCNAFKILARCTIPVETLAERVRGTLRSPEYEKSFEEQKHQLEGTMGRDWWEHPELWAATKTYSQFIGRSLELAQQEGEFQYGTQHMLLALAEAGPEVGGGVLTQMGITVDKVRQVATNFSLEEESLPGSYRLASAGMGPSATDLP
jgi:hypothetical protein